MGSSMTYSLRPAPARAASASSRAILSRCASPPDRVVAGWPSRRYPSPTCCTCQSAWPSFSSRGKKRIAWSTVSCRTSCDVAPVHPHLEHFGLEALAAAGIAGHEDVGHEHHLHFQVAGALAGLAAAAGDVEAEGARRVPALAGERRRGEDPPDLVERLDVGDGVGPRRAPDRLLVDEHDVVHRLPAGERVERADALAQVLLGGVLAVQPRSPVRDRARRARACSCPSRRRR